jgi:hypothetical protein
MEICFSAPFRDVSLGAFAPLDGAADGNRRG